MLRMSNYQRGKHIYLNGSNIDATPFTKDIGYRLGLFWVSAGGSRSMTFKEACPVYLISKAGGGV